MANRKEHQSCTLSLFEKRLYCAKKRVNKKCTNLPLLNRRCPYLVWNREDVMGAAKEGSRQIVSWSGFTEKAIQYAERFRPGLRLVHRDKIVKSRKRKPRKQAIAA